MITDVVPPIFMVHSVCNNNLVITNPWQSHSAENAVAKTTRSCTWI